MAAGRGPSPLKEEKYNIYILSAAYRSLVQ